MPSSRAALYHRVSTVDQHPELARKELGAAAKQRGFKVVLDIEETGSGARNDRPGLQRIMEAARKGQIDVVVVWKLDRFGRSALDLLANIETLTRGGVAFEAISQGLCARPDGDPMSRLMLTMLAAFSEFERGLIQERTRLGMQRARERGSAIGRPRLAPRPDPSAVVSLREQGRSWEAIGDELGCGPSAARRATQELAKVRR